MTDTSDVLLIPVFSVAVCPANCESCVVRDGAVYCTTCDARFALTEQGRCTGCPGNCNTCSSTNGNLRCSSCDAGFSLAIDRSSCTGKTERGEL